MGRDRYSIKTPEAWFPTDDEMDRIITAAGRSPDKSASSRDTSIMHILFFGGIRIGELIRLNLDDIRDIGIYVRSEKGKSPVWSPFQTRSWNH